MAIYGTGTQTYLFLNGVSVQRKIALDHGVAILPVHHGVEPVAPSMFSSKEDYAVGLLMLDKISAQIHVIGDDPKSLATKAWNAQWDAMLIGALHGCEVVCNFQSGAPFEELKDDSPVLVTNYHLRGLLTQVRELDEEDAQWCCRTPTFLS